MGGDNEMGGVPVLVIRAAGINCDEETAHCWRLAGAVPSLTHVNELADSPSMLDNHAVVTIPGGFSYGDDIAAGTILAHRIHQAVADPLRAFVDRGGGVLGICNGFQVLVKMGLLPGGEFGRDQVTVTYNDSAKFEARWVRLEISTDKCPFLTPQRRSAHGRAVPAGAAKTAHAASAMPSDPRTGGFGPGGTASLAIPHLGQDRGTGPADERAARYDMHVATPASRSERDPADLIRDPSILEMPVEHAEGKVVTASDTVALELLSRGQVALRYIDAEGNFDRYPANPNGSSFGIAGLCDSTGRVFGLMPHPDRHFDHTQHPLWTRRRPTGPPDGLTVFLNAVRHWG